jgi:TRAP-type C4-dicarboxylate transport system permease small subunit
MRGLLRITLSFSKWVNGIAGITLTFMVFLTVADVIMRSFRRPIPGTYDLVGFAAAVVIGFSLPFTSWVRGHINVDFVVQKFSRTGRKIIDILTRVLGIFFFVLGSWYLIKLGMRLHSTGEVSLTIRMPVYPIAYGLAVCCFIECLVLLCDIGKIYGGEYE